MKELALQVMDIVTLRPEVELCYLGISNKCFEILEGKYNDDATVSFPRSETGATSPQGSISGSDEESEEEDDDEDDHDDLDQHPTASGPQHNGNSDSGDESFGESDVDSEGEERREREPNMKLREILFYDEKITIFKARHAKL